MSRRIDEPANDNRPTLNTAFLLMAQYNGKAVIPLAVVCSDYFSHLTELALMRKVNDGEINLPIVKMEQSQKSARGVHLQDLADYIDQKRADAVHDLKQLVG